MKITCTDYNEPKDEFHFTTVIETVGGALKEAVIIKTGTEIFDLGMKPLQQASTEEIGIYAIYHRHYEEVPQDMLNQSVEV